jgi:hypothetical protein
MGVEPTQDGAGRPATVLKTVAINHSATPPRVDLLDRIRANRGLLHGPDRRIESHNESHEIIERLEGALPHDP